MGNNINKDRNRIMFTIAIINMGLSVISHIGFSDFPHIFIIVVLIIISYLAGYLTEQG